MRNVNEHMRGATVVAAGIIHNRAILPSFPGWGQPGEFDHFRNVADGERGVIVNVESHGMNPWTRYSIKWEDGSRSYGVDPRQVQIVNPA